MTSSFRKLLHMFEQQDTHLKSLSFFNWVLFFTVLVFLSRYNFLIFHTVAEGFSIVIAFSVFVLGWHSSFFSKNYFLRFVAVAFFFVAVLDFIHMMVYDGLNILEPSGADMATQFWIAARYMESIAMIIAPFSVCRGTRKYALFMGFSIITALVIYSIIFTDIFPACYIEGSGLTPFKIMSEYIICIFFGIAILAVRRNNEHLYSRELLLIQVALVVSIMAELTFTLYKDLYGLYNVAGHFLKVISFFLIYKAMVKAVLNDPQEMLFSELAAANNKLKSEKEKLQKALAEVKSLRELLPICASCKKIRDDKGYWTQIESYLSKHADYQFTHGICPECISELYPEYASKLDNQKEQ